MKSFILLCILAISALAQTNSDDKIQPLKTTVTVNATINAETPVPVITWPQQKIELTPGDTMDDRLRQIPGFSLFRRSSSEVANPTTQGVSLRGVGSTGSSRTLILWDGIPLNDPFGGWVYWDRIDPYYIDRIEVEPGAPISVFGDRAMSGTLSIFSPPETHQAFEFTALGGNESTGELSAGYANLWGRWGVSVHSRDMRTDGYYIVPEYLRGTADTRANVEFATGSVNLDYLGVSNRLAIHFDVLAEARANGTNFTHNSTGVGTLGATYMHSWANDQISVLAFRTQGQFHSSYSSVGARRNVENLTALQTVPEQDLGSAAYWKHHAHGWNTLVGSDVEDIHGISKDFSLTTRRLTNNGGTLLEHGVFGQGDVALGPARFYGGVRHQFTGQHDDTFVSANGGATVGLREFKLRVSGYRSFRAPTLNELFRPFRVGNVLTLANADLKAESMVGAETGVDWIREQTRFSVTLFHYDLSNLLTNVTIAQTATQITRQRENYPSALSRGVQADFAQRWHNWAFNAGYLFADARISAGQRIPQVPKQQGTSQLTYTHNATFLSFGLRAYGLQFDDDVNQFKLPGFASIGASAEQRIGHGVSVLASVDNLLDRSYLVALTPTPNTGQPLLWRLGLRWTSF